MERSSKVLVQEEDIFSYLPDSIICHILSLMPTKYAARTSILSRGWKQLFRKVPNLLIDEDNEQNDDFADFMSRRLTLYKTADDSISEFRLRLPKLPKPSAFNLWVDILLLRKVKVLEIVESGKVNPLQSPPRALFVSETLVDLKLCAINMVLKIPDLVLLPKLKKLHLEYLVLQSDFESESLRFDQQRYPLLEALILDSVRFCCSKGDARVGIFSATLKQLVIFVDDHKMLEIDIDTPCLRCFGYETFSEVELSFSKSEHLELASLHDHFNTDHAFYAPLMRLINNVKTLGLFCFNAADLNYSLPQFPNLTSLSLTRTGYQSLWSILENAPNLDVLHYIMSEDNLEFIPPNDVPVCLAQSLKEIKLDDFDTLDIDFVKYGLEHGAMLEKVTLKTPNDVDSRVISTELLMLPRRSPKCVIKLELGST